jgi:hypothetical protein
VALHVADHALEKAGMAPWNAVQHEDAGAAVVPLLAATDSQPVRQRKGR